MSINNTIQVPKAPEPTKFPLKSPCGARLATRIWIPAVKGGANNIKAVVLIVHGGGWHSGYFEYLARNLNEYGYFVASYDQPGCGYSELNPNAPIGYTHLFGFDDLVDEVYEAIEWAKLEASSAVKDAGGGGGGGTSSSSSLPVYLLGESFGGIQVLAAGMETNDRFRSKISGVICLGAALRVAEQLLPPKFIIKVITFIAPYYAKTRMPIQNLEATFDNAFGDPQWAQIARNDPKVNIKPAYTMGAAAATLNTGETLMKHAHDFPIPLLAIHGKNDCRTQSQAIQEFVDRVGTDKATLVLLHTSGHQLLQDIDSICNTVITEIIEWLERQQKDY